MERDRRRSADADETERRRSLTQEMVFMRTKCNRMDLIRNLNLWGNDLRNISILRHMPNLEVLSLSVNGVTSLAALRSCPKLAELYLRKNDIRDLAEVHHLAGLRQLRVLWLNDNPCATLPHYRQYVLHHLPHLAKLDSQDVTEDERRRAYESDFGDVQTCVGLPIDSYEASPVDDHSPLVADAYEESPPGRGHRGGIPRDDSYDRDLQSAPPGRGQRCGLPQEDPYGDLQPAPSGRGQRGGIPQEDSYNRDLQSAPSGRGQRGGMPQEDSYDMPQSAADRFRREPGTPVRQQLSERSPAGRNPYGDESPEMMLYEHYDQRPPQLPPQQHQQRRVHSGPLHHDDHAWQERPPERPQHAWSIEGTPPHRHASARMDERDHDSPGPERLEQRSASRADNILCAVLALTKELDQQGLELVRRAIEQRQCEM